MVGELDDGGKIGGAGKAVLQRQLREREDLKATKVESNEKGAELGNVVEGRDEDGFGRKGLGDSSFSIAVGKGTALVASW